MRVLMLGWEFPPHVTGGLGTACRGITEGLASHGIRVLFVVPHSSGESVRHGARVVGCGEPSADPAPPEHGRPEGRLDLLGVPSGLRPYLGAGEYAQVTAEERESTAFGGGYGSNLFDEVERYAEVVAQLARDERFDIIHAHDWMTFPAAERVRAESGKPLVCHVHACEHDRSGEGADRRILSFEAEGLANADRVVCVSRYTAAKVREHYEVDDAKLRVVHNAIGAVGTNGASAGARPSPGGEGPVVLFFGRVTAQKGPGYFLDAARLVLEAEPNVRFVMSGTGNLLPEMVEYAAELGLSRNVHFTGYLTDEEVETVFAMADLFVLSSVSEPFGLTPLEALSRGVPVIVSRQSGVSEVLKSCPKVDYWDTQGLADKVLTLLRRPSLRRQLAEAGLLEVRNMRWERRAEVLLDVYRELV